LDLDLASVRLGLDRAVAPAPPAPSAAGQYGETEDDESDCASGYEDQERYGHGREGRGREARLAASASPFFLSFAGVCICGFVASWASRFRPTLCLAPGFYHVNSVVPFSFMSFAYLF
jgi:hypothetical protein